MLRLPGDNPGGEILNLQGGCFEHSDYWSCLCQLHSCRAIRYPKLLDDN